MTVVNALIGIVVLVAVIANQLRTQPVGTRRLRLAGVLGVVGVLQIRAAVTDHPPAAVGWVLLLAGLAVGAGLGVWRAYSMALWSDGARVLTRGTWFTAGLWVLGIAAHVGLDLLTRVLAPDAEAVGSASILLFVAVSLGAQALAVLRRARVEQPELAASTRVGQGA